MLDLCCLSLLVPDFFVSCFHYLFDLGLFLLKLLLVMILLFIVIVVDWLLGIFLLLEYYYFDVIDFGLCVVIGLCSCCCFCSCWFRFVMAGCLRDT